MVHVQGFLTLLLFMQRNTFITRNKIYKLLYTKKNLEESAYLDIIVLL